jgi:hypothetical protein
MIRIDWHGDGPRLVQASELDVDEWALKFSANYGSPRHSAFVVLSAPDGVAVIRVVPGQFHIQIIPTGQYATRPDPFLWAEHPDGEFEIPPRTTESLNAMFRMPDTDLPWLLGGCQTLLNGNKLILIRPSGSDTEIRKLWKMLPTPTQAEVRFATLAPHLGFGCDFTVLPEAPDVWPAGHANEEQTRDTPEGRYELALQVAVESGDEASLQRLLARRTSDQMLRIMASVVGGMIVVGVVVRLVLG